jgi:hypothetical protein
VTLQINTTKTWKLEELAQQAYPAHRVEAWIYYCTLCDEILVVTRRFVEGKGVHAAFDGICPDCGFSLDDVMRCERAQLPHTRSAYVNPKCQATLLAEFPSGIPQTIRLGNASLSADETLTTGIEKLDKLVHLTTGQFTVFQGYPFPKSLAELLCVRAQLDHPIGLNSATVFIDGGNSFDAYAVSNYAVEHRIESKLALSRIHISRAFTYFQLASLLIERLPSALLHYNSRFAIISDITELFQDPEIKDKQEAHRVFQRMLRSLLATAEMTDSLVIAISPCQYREPFTKELIQTAHTFIRAEDRGTLTQFSLLHHHSLPSRKTSHREDSIGQFLEYYLTG